MKKLLTIVLISLPVLATGQVLDLEPTLGKPFNFSPEAIKKFNSPEAFEACNVVYERLRNEGRSWEDRTPEEEEILQFCEETKSSIFDAVSGGCSWYCGGGPKEVKASSTLASQGNNSYIAKNAHDLSFKTGWVEGVKGNGIGEYLTYYFSGDSPGINKIKIASGYVKSESAWRNNSRIKKINMYVDDKLFAYLNLKDVRALQSFDIPVVSRDREKYPNPKNSPMWTLKFEIAEVYPGNKYEDAVISEIFFDGVGVHCLAPETMITMSDQSNTAIENLEIGMQIMAYETSTGKLLPATILEMAAPFHEEMITITLSNGQEITATPDHPFYTGNQWVSFHPAKTMQDYNLTDVQVLTKNTIINTANGQLRVKSISKKHQTTKTYTITKLSQGDAYLANGMLTGITPINRNMNQFTHSHSCPLNTEKAE